MAELFGEDDVSSRSSKKAEDEPARKSSSSSTTSGVPTKRAVVVPKADVDTAGGEDDDILGDLGFEPRNKRVQHADDDDDDDVGSNLVGGSLFKSLLGENKTESRVIVAGREPRNASAGAGGAGTASRNKSVAFVLDDKYKRKEIDGGMITR
jgi:hypothetical protein